MALDLPLRLRTSVPQTPSFTSRLARTELIVRGPSDGQSIEPGQHDHNGTSAQGARRTRIWEFDTNLHCSIIGTCLGTAELRHVLVKLKVGGAGVATDHDLHSMGVVLAGRREGSAKFLQKALDRQHRVAITRYAGAKDTAALLALWQESLKQGDIPGAYWAVLTHPMTTEAVVKRVFGDVHMLSHLVGAANRADIRRLRQLEQENAALLAKTERQRANCGMASPRVIKRSVASMRCWLVKTASYPCALFLSKSRMMAEQRIILFATCKSGWRAKPCAATAWSDVSMRCRYR